MTLDVNDIIEMALCDHTSFAQIKAQCGIGEEEVKKLMRQNLKPGSYRLATSSTCIFGPPR
jgi:uncharacterized protein (TIGR03643 family)